MSVHFRGVLTLIFCFTGIGAAHAQPAAGDQRRGKILFLQCAACHATAPGAPAKVGPNLSGVMDAAAASRPGFSYSDALKKAGYKWSDARMNAFLEKPSAAVPGTKMIFGGISDATKRADIIAYLRSLP